MLPLSFLSPVNFVSYIIVTIMKSQLNFTLAFCKYTSHAKNKDFFLVKSKHLGVIIIKTKNSRKKEHETLCVDSCEKLINADICVSIHSLHVNE